MTGAGSMSKSEFSQSRGSRRMAEESAGVVVRDA